MDWVREPFEYIVQVGSKEKRKEWYTNSYILESGRNVDDFEISLHIKRRVRKEGLVVTATLINNSDPHEDNWDKHCLFQTGIRIQIDKNSKYGIINRPAFGVPQDEDDI